MKNEIVIFEQENIKLEVNLQDYTVWLTKHKWKCYLMLSKIL